LKLIASTGRRNAAIDVEAAAERGIVVAHTRYDAHPDSDGDNKATIDLPSECQTRGGASTSESGHVAERAQIDAVEKADAMHRADRFDYSSAKL
jgi:lactate dehydrogenase-like 2-hydroxyacid dehydrogenase